MERIDGTQRVALYGTIARQAWELAEKYGLHGEEQRIRKKLHADAEEAFGSVLRDIDPGDFQTALVWAENWEDAEFLRRRRDLREKKKKRT